MPGETLTIVVGAGGKGGSGGYPSGENGEEGGATLLIRSNNLHRLEVTGGEGGRGGGKGVNSTAWGGEGGTVFPAADKARSARGERAYRIYGGDGGAIPGFHTVIPRGGRKEGEDGASAFEPGAGGGGGAGSENGDKHGRGGAGGNGYVGIWYFLI